MKLKFRLLTRFRFRVIQAFLLVAAILKVVEYYSPYGDLYEVIGSDFKGLSALVFLFGLLVVQALIDGDIKRHQDIKTDNCKKISDEAVVTIILFIGVIMIYYVL